MSALGFFILYKKSWVKVAEKSVIFVGKLTCKVKHTEI